MNMQQIFALYQRVTNVLLTKSQHCAYTERKKEHKTDLWGMLIIAIYTFRSSHTIQKRRQDKFMEESYWYCNACGTHLWHQLFEAAYRTYCSRWSEHMLTGVPSLTLLHSHFLHTFITQSEENFLFVCRLSTWVRTHIFQSSCLRREPTCKQEPVFFQHSTENMKNVTAEGRDEVFHPKHVQDILVRSQNPYRDLYQYKCN